MSQSPINITYSLEDILLQINQKLDNVQKDITDLKIGQARLEGRMDKLETDLTGKMEKLEIELTGRMEKLEIELTGKMERLETELTAKMEKLETELTAKIEAVETRLEGKIDQIEAKLTGKIETVSIEVKAIDQRLDTQEFINRSVVVGLILAIMAGAIKIFFPNFPNPN